MSVVRALAAVLVLCCSPVLSEEAESVIKPQMCRPAVSEDTIYQFSENPLNSNTTRRLSRYGNRVTTVFRWSCYVIDIPLKIRWL